MGHAWLYPKPNNLLTNWALDFDLLSFLQKSFFVCFPFIQTLRSYFHLIFDNFPPRISLVFTTVKKLEMLKRACTFLLDKITSLFQSVRNVDHSKMRVCIPVPPIIPDHIPYNIHSTSLFVKWSYILNWCRFLKYKMSFNIYVYKRYLDSKVEIEAKEKSKGDTNNIIASDVHICHISLPSAPDSHTFWSILSSSQYSGVDMI